MRKKVKVRKADKADRDAMARIMYEVRTEDFFWIDPEFVAHDDFEIQTEGEDIYVAEVGGEICGFISVWRPSSFIHHLYVDKNSRGRGIGLQLLAVAAEKYPLPLRLKCAEKNESAMRFYERNGWKVIEREDSDDPDCFLMEYLGSVEV